MPDDKKKSLGRSLLDLLLGAEEPEPLPINEEAPWLTELEPTPEPSPTPEILVIPSTAEEQAEAAARDPAGFLAEQLAKRRQKMLPLQYLANPPAVKE